MPPLNDNPTTFDYLFPMYATVRYDNWDSITIPLIYGIETHPLDLPRNGQADYDGKMEIWVGGYANDTGERAGLDLTGDLTLSASFAGQQTIIEGHAVAENKYSDTSQYIKEFDILPTEINDDGTFSASIVNATQGCGDTCAEVILSDLSGGFYGPNANEVGGTILLGVDVPGIGELLGHGLFMGAQTDTAAQ